MNLLKLPPEALRDPHAGEREIPDAFTLGERPQSGQRTLINPE